MTTTVNVYEAKTRLSELIALVEAGEEVIIARNGKPVVRMDVVFPPAQRELGFMRSDEEIPDSFFFDPLPDHELAAWEGRS